MLHGIVKKAKTYLNSLKLEFSDREMENDYWSLKKENTAQDFQICLKFLISFNLLVAILAVEAKSWNDIYISLGIDGLFVFLYCIRKYLVKHIQIVTLIIIFSYDISRLFMLQPPFKSPFKGNVFQAGYGLANIQGVLLFRLLKLSQKAIGVVILLILRYLIVSVYIEPGSFSSVLFVRHCFIDAYVIYNMYEQEANFRKVYQNFTQKKDELLKFKELLAESLPQSLVVVSSLSESLLFYNKTFQNMFSMCKDFKLLKAHLESLSVDESTIRDVGTTNHNLDLTSKPKAHLPLAKVLSKFESDECMNEKTISLVACTTLEEGSRRLFEVTLKHVKWDNKDAIAILFNDITYQENLMALKLSNINKDKVIATVSHELRTPLNGIIGILDITKNRVDDPKAVEYLSLCKDNAHLLLSLVNSILDLQQISTGKLKLNLEHVNIRQIMTSIAQLFVFQCREKNISFEYDIHRDVPITISTDQNRLKQVLINLIGNAIKFTSKGGIKVNIFPNVVNPETLQISVIDTGIGIKHENRKHLFKMYSKIEDGASVNKHGVGLGLTISNALAVILNGGSENHGIQLESEYGTGSKFSFKIQRNLKEKNQKGDEIVWDTKLPLSKDESDSTKGGLLRKAISYGERIEEGHESSLGNFDDDYNEFVVPPNLQSKLRYYASLKKMENSPILSPYLSSNPYFNELLTSEKDCLKTKKFSFTISPAEPLIDTVKAGLDILIIDDNPFNLLVAKNLIQEFGRKIITALGGQEAIDIIKMNLSEGLIFKVIFMDCQMPIMDGFETTKILRAMMKSGEIPEVPIYGWTANNSEEDVKRCYEVGMVGHLPKPASKGDFSKVISQI